MSFKQLHQVSTCLLDTIQDFLCKLGMKPHMQIVKISIFSLNNVIIRPTKIIMDLCKATTQIAFVYILALQRSLIIFVGLTMTSFSEKTLIFNICRHGLMPNLIKKSWTVSTVYIVPKGHTDDASSNIFLLSTLISLINVEGLQRLQNL